MPPASGLGYLRRLAGRAAPSDAADEARAAARRRALVVLTALVLLAFTLRGPVTAVAPVVNELRSDLGIGPMMAGLLTGIPVLCFGLLTPAASSFIGRAGIEASIFVTLAGAALGMIIRPAGGIEVALVGTVILGAALTIGNIVSLMVIARDFPRHLQAATGVYASALNVGTMLTSALTAPLSVWLGWRSGLAAWALLAVVAAAAWTIALRRGAPPASGPARPAAAAARPATPRPSVWRRPLVWLLVLAFTAHLLIYYGLTSWLPAYLMQTDGMNATTAGLVASAFQILALLGSFGVPALGGRVSRAVLLAAMGIFWLVTPLGLLAAPEHWLLWSITGGTASGGGFTATFMLIMEHTADLDDNRKVSSAVQGLGYAIASVGPLVVGGLHQASGQWTSGFLLMAATSLVMVLSGIGAVFAGRPCRPL